MYNAPHVAIWAATLLVMLLCGGWGGIAVGDLATRAQRTLRHERDALRSASNEVLADVIHIDRARKAVAAEHTTSYSRDPHDSAPSEAILGHAVGGGPRASGPLYRKVQ